jgi:hypothetical protein
MYVWKAHATREAPLRDQDDQPDAREGRAGRTGVAERPVEGFSHFVTSMTAPIASGWSEAPGKPCTNWKAPPFHGARRKQSSRATEASMDR